MGKFNAGDKVLRIDSDYCLAEKGGIYEVASCTDGGGLELVGHPRGSDGLAKYSAGSFKLVQAASPDNTTNNTKEILMSKFNVGDRVKRTGVSIKDIIQGGIYTVEQLRSTHAILLCESTSTQGYSIDLFELVIGVDTGLTDKEVFNAIVDGKPLQYSFVGKPEWYDLKYPEKLTLLDVQRGTYRVRPTDVKLECTVPYPEYSVGRVYSNSVRKYSVDFGTGKIRDFGEAELPQGGVFWSSREQAEQFRDTVLASLQGK